MLQSWACIKKSYSLRLLQSRSTEAADFLARYNLFVASKLSVVESLRTTSITASPVTLSLISIVNGNSSLFGLNT